MMSTPARALMAASLLSSIGLAAHHDDDARSWLAATAAPHPASDDEGSIEIVRHDQGYVARFDEIGVRFAALGDAAAPEWTWSLALTACGRGGGSSGLATAEPALVANGVELRRGGVVEWYVNRRGGIEQGFTIASRPEGDGPLVLTLVLGGSLVAAIDATGATLELANDGAAPILRFANLVAFDRRGIGLPARFELADGALRVIVADAGAEYPVVVDPLVTSTSSQFDSDQANAWLGYSVAVAGDVNADGYSDVVVGAPMFDNGQSNEGRAFVLLGGAAGLAAAPVWTAEPDQAAAQFGYSVGGAGDVNADGFSDVLVGAPFFDNGQTNEGRAFLYSGGTGGPSAAAAWIAEPDQASAQFGGAVAGAGDVDSDGFDDVAIGSHLADNGQADEGRVFAYRGSATGLGAATAWAVESNQAAAQLGWSVAGGGDVNGDGFSDLLASANEFDNGQASEGGAFAWYGSAAGIGATASWTVESNQASAELGTDVACAGDVNGDGFADAAVGSRHFTNGQSLEGRAFAFHGSAGGLATVAAWTAESNQVTADFGLSLAGAGDVNGDGYDDLIVSAPTMDAGQIDEGLAFVYEGSPGGLATGAAWTAQSDQASAQFGHSVGGGGDVNGDGFSDVIVGAYQFDAGQSNEGRAVVYYGTPCTTPSQTTSYGAGKAGPAGVPVLSSSLPAIPGFPLDLAVSNGPPFASGLLIVGFAPAALPFDLGTLLVSPFSIVPIALNGSGAFALSFPAPATAALCGFAVYLQAMAVDPGAVGFYHTVQTAGLSWTFGT